MGIDLAHEEGNLEEESRFEFQTSKYYSEVGLVEESLEHGMQGLRVARKSGISKRILFAHFGIGSCYLSIERFEDALVESQSALEVAQEMQDSTMMAWCYNMFGEVFRLSGNLDSAETSYYRAWDYFQSDSVPRGLDIIQHNLGLVYAGTGRFEESRLAFAKVKDPSGLQDAGAFEKGLAEMDILYGTNGLAAAVRHGDELVERAREERLLRWELEVIKKISGLYLDNGYPAEALRYYQVRDSLEEIFQGEQVEIKVRLLQQDFNLERTQTEVALLEQQNANQRILIVSAIAILGLLLAIAFILFRSNRRIGASNDQLAQRNHQLDDLIEEKDIWINLMAHDLKAPLSAIKGLLALAQDELTPAEVRQQAFQKIERVLDNGTEMVSQLLELARVESNEMQIKDQEVQLNELLQDIQRGFLPLAERKSLALTMEESEQSLSYRTDAQIVRRILENFLSNAIKFSLPGKAIALILEERSHGIALSVKDEGPGISPADQQKLFQKFQKLSARPTAGESSTGLGLSIVKALAEKIGAELEIHSELGKGATFTLLLPATSPSTK